VLKKHLVNVRLKKNYLTLTWCECTRYTERRRDEQES